VENGIDVTVKVSGQQTVEEFLFVDVIGDVAID